MEYNKLVRDNIPQIIKAKGEKPKTHIADKNEFLTKLKEKLREETEEFSKSEEREELVDILEVLYALAQEKGITKEELEAIRKQKAKERGAFENKIILESVDKD
jgi:predicted house-cleaning noncanonical NTP pyrophosphatase (MazG superfamily)